MTDHRPGGPSGSTSPSIEIVDLVERWETMSEHYLEGRRTLVDDVVGQLVQRIDKPTPVAVELGSGPGALLARLTHAMPSARLVGIEVDPVLRRLHQCGSAGADPDLVQVVDADLSSSRWLDALPTPGPVDAVIAVQVLHYFPPTRFNALLGEIRSLLVDGGIFVHLDRVPLADRRPTTSGATPPITGDPWQQWWAAARRVPILSEATRNRDRWLSGPTPHSAEHHPDARSLRADFGRAGLENVLFGRRVGDSLLTVVGLGSPPTRAV